MGLWFRKAVGLQETEYAVKNHVENAFAPSPTAEGSSLKGSLGQTHFADLGELLGRQRTQLRLLLRTKMLCVVAIWGELFSTSVTLSLANIPLLVG